MIRDEIVNYIAEKKSIESKEHIEKDILLHNILYYLSKNKDFVDGYAFKGGTCLIKSYLGYYRFSEDLDFTYINQKESENKSGKAIRTVLSKKIDGIGELIQEISKKIGFRFVHDKSNEEYVKLGGSNVFVTFKLWFDDISGNKNFIKIQINYREALKFDIVKSNVNSLLEGNDKEFYLLFPNDAEIMTKPLLFNLYDIREILIEKFRAILTRKGTKFRDFVDIYKIIKLKKYNLEDFEQDIIDKVTYAIKFEKYTLNLNSKIKGGLQLSKEEEEKIVLHPLDNDFEAFYNQILSFADNILTKLKNIDKDEVVKYV